MRELPADIDPECRELCEAMNRLPGILTVESCCGHAKWPYRIYFIARDLEALPAVTWSADSCHSGAEGWSVTVHTDCGPGDVWFTLEGPVGPGAYAGAVKVAETMTRFLER